MDRERLLESLYRFRDFLVAEGNTQVDLWPLANAIRWIAAEPEPGTTTLSDGVRMCAGWLTEAGHGELADVMLAASGVTTAPNPPRYEASKLAAHLNNIAEIMERPACDNTNWHQDHPDAIREAARRLSCDSLAPPPPDSVPVRIAVAVSQDGRVAAHGVWADITRVEAMADCHDDLFGPATHEDFVTAHISPRVVRDVAGTVEAIDDPEATI